MAKTLELQFTTELGKIARLSLDNPKEPVNEAAVKQAMEQIIASDVFTTANGKFVSVKAARVVDRNITDYDMA
ncbi:DUF2922 domain-containing protein [Bacillus sp. BRMEA1]|uniref:DUF2922 domain-containing protein n=1 Tax=Neobacillus endophyticus TaxID=2738405 RepID=UPI001563BCEF|nr:DUF2922 domain-containing protein [Neobacillus endophyticus]NRD76923.1 DUF2922 domain-containing protein [Neobacillus endophyticus]